MTLALASDQAAETIRVPVMVYPDQASADKAAAQETEPEAEGAIRFLKEQAWKIGVIMEPVSNESLSRSG